MQAQGGQTNRAGRDRSGLGSRRVVWTSFGISVALPLLFIGLSPAYGTLERDNPNLPSPDFTVSSDALELLRLIEAELASDSERPEDPQDVRGAMHRLRHTVRDTVRAGSNDEDTRKAISDILADAQERIAALKGE